MLSHSLDRLASVFAVGRDGLRRVPIGVQTLRRLAAVEMVSDRPSLHEAIQWIPPVRVGGRSHVRAHVPPKLACRLPRDAARRRQRRVLLCPGPAVWNRDVGGVEFEICVRTQGHDPQLACARSAPRRDRGGEDFASRGGAGPALLFSPLRVVAGGAAESAAALWETVVSASLGGELRLGGSYDIFEWVFAACGIERWQER